MSKIEGAINYLSGVGARTLGLNGFKVARDSLASPTRLDQTLIGASNGYLEVVFPATSEFMNRDYINVQRRIPYSRNLNLDMSFLSARMISSMMYDGASLYLLGQVYGHSLPELIIMKLALNAVTHIGTDIAGVAIRSTRSYRSSSAAISL